MCVWLCARAVHVLKTQESFEDHMVFRIFSLGDYEQFLFSKSIQSHKVD